MTWVQTHTGRGVSFLAPTPREITIDDIAVSLSRIPRFHGATTRFYSVAQHSVHCYEITRHASPTDAPAALWSLLHDAHEAYTGDLPTPFKCAVLALLPKWTIDPFKAITDKLDLDIMEAFGINSRDITDALPLVKRADMIALATEKAQLMLAPPTVWGLELPPPDEIELMPLASGHAEFLFRAAYDRAICEYRVWQADRRPKLVTAAE